MTTGLRTKTNALRTISLGCALTAAALVSHADTVYDNLSNPLGFYAGGFGPYAEIADEVFLAGSSRIFESVSIAYTAFRAPDDATMTISLYEMDGAPTPASFGANTPGTLLFQQTVPVVNSDSWLVTVTDSSGSIVLPDHVGVGLSFTGIDYDASGADAGPLLLDPPTIGSSYSDFFIRGSEAYSGWGLFLIGDVAANFGVQITTVPDSASWLNLLSIPLVFGVHRALRRSKSA